MYLTKRQLYGVSLLLSGFLVIALGVSSEQILLRDEAVLRWVGTYRAAELTRLMQWFTVLGDGVVEIPLTLGVVLLLWLCRRVHAARCLLVAGLTGELLYVLLKWTFGRPRPRVIEHLSGAGWYSFPSGHAMLAPVTWGMALFFLSHLSERVGYRLSCRALMILIPLWIGISRVYLGVHYLSDVIAGLLLGTAWAMIWIKAGFRQHEGIAGQVDQGVEQAVGE